MLLPPQIGDEQGEDDAEEHIGDATDLRLPAYSAVRAVSVDLTK